jgi:hypothetical protein
MVLEQLMDEVKKMFDDNDNQVKIDQGKQFLKFKKMREGFTASEKNLNEFNEMDQLDTDLQRSISNYATASKTLASDTLNYLESEKNVTGLKETNVAVVKLNPYPAGKYEGCFADKDFSAIGKPVAKGVDEATCRNMAIQQNKSVYGIQNVDENGKGDCMISDDLNKAKKMGTPSINQYSKNAGGAGSYGGYYTCPDGTTYEVGDVSGSGCGSLDGVGGVAGECFQKSGSWSGNKVVCGKPSNDKLGAMGYVKNPTYVNPPLKLPSNISTDGRCGPGFGNKVCPGNTCCSQFGWCGGKQGTSSAWCSDGQEGIDGGKFDGKPILQTSVSNNKNNPPTYIGGKAGPDNSRDHSYVFKTRQQAESACKSYGFDRLATTDEVRGWQLCATGWTNDGVGWWWGPDEKSGCGQANNWNSWKPDDGAGAWCYGKRKPTAAPIVGCKKGPSNFMGGTTNSNAVYSQKLPENADLRKVGYINEKGVISEYPKSMIKKGNTYTMIAGQDSPPNNLNEVDNTSVEGCKKICTDDDNCAGFAYSKSNKKCWTKNSKMYPEDKALIPNSDIDLYVRNPSLDNNASCSNKIVGINTDQFKSFKNTGKEMSMDSLCGLAGETKTLKENVKNERTKIMSLSEKIVNKMESLTKDKSQMDNLQPDVQNKLLKSINNYKRAVKNIKGGEKRNETIDGQVDNSDLLLINRNFNYVMWSIVAIIAVIVTIKVVRK